MGKRYILLIVAVLAIAVECMAQQTISRDDIRTRVIAYTNDALAEASDAGIVAVEPVAANIGIPSVDNENYLQIGTSLPSLVQTMLFGLSFGVDADELVGQPVNFSQMLAAKRYYWGNEWMVNAINLEYGHKVKDWLALGAKGYLGFTTRARRHIVTNDVLYRETMWATSIIFNARFEWLCREIVTLYSSVGVGCAILVERRNNEVWPMFDLTAVGLSVGKRFYGYVELGSGVSGGLRAGVGVRF